MKQLLCFLLLMFLIEVLDARRFRCDYTYSKEANGYIKYQEIPATWHDARLRCHLEGTVLASPITTEIRNLMVRMYNDSSKSGMWTGIHSIFSKEDYTSVEGIRLSDIPHVWMKNEPDNDNNLESCLVQIPDGKLADGNCNETLPYFCFKKITPRMSMNSCGSPDSGYNLDQRTGKCYKFHKMTRIWSRAFMTCMSEGGHLAIINSEVESNILKEIFAKYPPGTYAGPEINTDVVFVGFHDWNERGEYLTIHGQTLNEAGYERWNPGEPNNPDSQFCGGMFRNGNLDNSSCEKRSAFICEKDPESLMCDHDE
ncbi:C-type mannose receptor 2-like [Pectinophora gossypiella]|uniref:C-type mannose receptor 2-like n=1 Tax=Pectinophora gossypiella TaxID=13191 RepID=UPI00214E343D|nr:C-type mannose receptor 2-like [Pectinophora gossypiella]